MLFFDLNIINLVIIIASLFPTILGLFIYSHNRHHKPSKFFFFFTITAGLWGVARVLAQNAITEESTLILFRLLYPIAATMPLTFIYFIYALVKKHYKFTKYQFWLPIVIFAIISAIAVIPNLMIIGVTLGNGAINNDVMLNNKYFTLYILGFVALFFWGYMYIVLKYKQVNKLEKKKLLYIFIGTLSSVLVGIIANLVLPLFGINKLNWIGPISTAVASIIIVYGMFKHRVFDIRVIVAQITIFILWLIILIRIVASNTLSDIIFNTVTLVVFIIIGVLLLRSMNNEIQGHDKLKRLNKKLKELDKKKTEFLHIATHQLRGPITTINGYTSLILEGDYGEIDPKLKDPLTKILSTTKTMSDTIRDYMNIARIEEKRISLNKEKLDICKYIEDLANKMRVNAEEKNLYLNYNQEVPSPCYVFVDRASISQVFDALIENAIKYTHNGGVTITVSKNANNIKISIKDTGIGVDKKEVKTLFDKFTRAENARKSDAFGTGMGLFIAKNLIEANGGKIKVESEGINKGSTFIVELPVVKG